MKKPLKIAIITLGILYGIFVILGQTGMLKMYNTPSTANEPGINLKSKVFVSNIANFENGDFVCYKYNDEMLGDHKRIHRLMGRSGDIVEIRNGVLFLNDINMDENLELKHFYIIEPDEFDELLDKKLIETKDLAYKANIHAMVFIINKIADENGLSSKIKIEPETNPNKAIVEMYNENWNEDNFGPLQIPPGKCFVIGDNRHNSEDSRYIGLINESDIIGTVVIK